MDAGEGVEERARGEEARSGAASMATWPLGVLPFPRRVTARVREWGWVSMRKPPVSLSSVSTNFYMGHRARG
jgi:hypothetical protein